LEVEAKVEVKVEVEVEAKVEVEVEVEIEGKADVCAGREQRAVLGELSALGGTCFSST
jgi:hypothetical protein